MNVGLGHYRHYAKEWYTRMTEDHGCPSIFVAGDRASLMTGNTWHSRENGKIGVVFIAITIMKNDIVIIMILFKNMFIHEERIKGYLLKTFLSSPKFRY